MDAYTPVGAATVQHIPYDPSLVPLWVPPWTPHDNPPLGLPW